MAYASGEALGDKCAPCTEQLADTAALSRLPGGASRSCLRLMGGATAQRRFLAPVLDVNREMEGKGAELVGNAGKDPRENEAVRVSVVVASWCRPENVRTCLQHLAQLTSRPDEVFVVDASPDHRTAAVVQDFPWAVWVPFPGGAGRMTASRNVGLLHVTGEIVAFIDDDAYVRAGWLDGLVSAFSDPTVAAVAGRACNGIAGEESDGLEAIGRVLPNGDLTGNFAADPSSTIDVDHGIGANMSFRREVLARLGGFRDDFIGTAVREDTDIFLRVRAVGCRAVFAPGIVVDHVGAPHVRGRRFDFRYTFCARRNHVLLLSRNFGLGSSQLRAWVARELRRTPGPQHASLLRRTVRVVMGVAGIACGIAVSLRKARWSPVDPMRRDRIGEAIRRHLSTSESRPLGGARFLP